MTMTMTAPDADEKGPMGVTATATAAPTEGILKTELRHDVSSPEPYSIYSKNEKWLIVGIVAVAGFYSPLPATIYFPAIPMMSKEFKVSIEAFNQTVTAYLVMQGASPMLWGPLSDRYGRRPVFLSCLTILVGSCIGLALCPVDKFWLLIVLRLLQSGGCASTIALGAGVTGDIAEPSERGGFFGLFNLGPMLAPSIGPAIAGALADNLGWRSIFWALVLMAATCLVLIYLLLPETLRHLVGNGSVPVKGIHRPLFPIVGRKHTKTATRPHQPKKQSINPFILFTYPDVVITLVFTGVIYSVNYSIMATTSSALTYAYPFLSTTLLGVCYLPTGAGMCIGSFITGKILDREYARIEKKRAETNDSSPFPKEYSRLRTMPIHLIILVAGEIGWGICIAKSAPLAITLILQAVVGWTGMAILNTTMTLMIDILQSRSSGATACTNFVRCSLGAIVVALTDRIVSSLGYIWTYVLLGGICAAFLPLMYVEMRQGPKWRLKRDKLEEEEQASSA
ncbi:major facilitator superfamily domain-containing protein [Xylariomycetidae sp. FL2044]|nr:major facilitator superfamily domain-containing protein [Xylariomycetidae sp. FL2044]